MPQRRRAPPSQLSWIRAPSSPCRRASYGAPTAAPATLFDLPMRPRGNQHDDIGGKRIGEEGERSGANGRGPARGGGGRERDQQCQTLDNGDCLATPIGNRVGRQRLPQERQHPSGGEIEITHGADREHPIGDGGRLYEGYRKDKDGERVELHVEA